MPTDPSTSSAVLNWIRQTEASRSHLLPLGGPADTAGLSDDQDMVLPVRVPLAGERNLLLRPHLAIRFRNRREGSDSKGVHLADLFRPAWESATLIGSQDIVLTGLGGPRRELKFRITWPGYESQQTTISSVSSDGGPLTRLQLARNIMYAYGKFFRKVVAERIWSRQDGPYNIALNQSENARGPDSLGVKFSELHLVKFREPVPGDNHWVAVIDIVRQQI